MKELTGARTAAKLEHPWEVNEATFRDVGRKAVAGDLGKSLSLIDKWCHPTPSVENPHGDGVVSPLELIDRLRAILQKRYPEAALLPLHWLAQRAGCHLVGNPDGRATAPHAELLAHLGSVMKDFSAFLSDAAEALADGVVTHDEALACRGTWEALRFLGASFTARMEAAAANKHKGGKHAER